MNKFLHYAKHPVVLTVIRVAVGGLFLVFGFAKAIEPFDLFYASIREYQLMPEILVEPFGIAMIFLEIAFGLFLTVGLFTKWSNRAIILLLLMFIIAITQALLRGLDLPSCGCSGSILKLGETPFEVLWRDGLMLIGLLWLERIKAYGYTLDSQLKST